MAVKNDVDMVTEEKVRKGGVLARLYFDMQDKDKEKLQHIMLSLVNDKLMKEKGVVYCYGTIEEPLEKDGIYITSATVTLLMDNFAPLIGIAFNYAPAGVEVLKPEKEIKLKTNEVQTILMDISQISINYSKYIFERVLKPEDMEAITRDLENRAEIGKKLIKGDDENQG
ncbi:MAG: hypothetical protein M1448_00490 [Candidatus Marsarchaeota archaeon]|nr:hypothetical protein [Candidatus Marsarchaeota archaeon]